MVDPWKRFSASGGFKKAENLQIFMEAVLGSGWLTGNSFSVLVTIIFFFIMYGAYRKSLLSGAPNGTPLRAVWMWDDPPAKKPSWPGNFTCLEVVTKPAVTTAYLGWAKARGIDRTWMDVANLHDKSVQLNVFLKTAKQHGMSTQFLFCATDDAGKDPTGIGAEDLANVLKLIKSLDADVWPTGVQSDLEYGLKDTKANATKAYNAHVSFRAVVAAFNKLHDSNLNLLASVMYWWINYEQENAPIVSGEDKAYGELLLELGLDVTVQDYRKPDPGWADKAAQAWCDLAGQHGRQASIGMAVGPPDPSDYDYDSSIHSLDNEMYHLAGSCIDKDGFGGMAVHDALWYGTMAP